MSGPLPISPNAVEFPTIPAIAGVDIAVRRAGFYKHKRNDVLLMRFAEGTTSAGVFTRHEVGSAPVDWCQRQIKRSGGEARALVVNAGCANSFTGKAGDKAAARVAAAAAKAVGCRRREVMLASTGVIGVLLDDGKITPLVPDLVAALDGDAWKAAAEAISTTDTFPKGAYAEASIDGERVHIAGITKGSGMVAPDMATILAFVVTDATLSPKVLRDLLGLYTARTFNAVTVDGDRSTNDTLLLFATGKSAAPKITRASDRRLADFRSKLEALLLDLAQQLVKDGEGATKFVKITVSGARSVASARKIARTHRRKPAGQDRLRRRRRQLGPHRRRRGPFGRAAEPAEAVGDLRPTHGGPRRRCRRRLLRGGDERLHEASAS